MADQVTSAAKANHGICPNCRGIHPRNTRSHIYCQGHWWKLGTAVIVGSLRNYTRDKDGSLQQMDQLS